MRKFKLFTLLLLSSMAMQLSAQTTTYKLVWADEFSATNLSNWNKEVTANPANNELQYYTDAATNVCVQDGNLVLTGRRESKGNKSFTSGRVNSNGKVGFTHGVVVARIKLPKTKGGLWPAFWMMGNDISTKGWPYCGELDIVEWGNSAGFGGREETYFSAAIHWGENWQSHAYYSYATNNSYSVQDGEYHNWICQWDENQMRCYLDNQTSPYFVANISDGYGPYPYVHKKSHILFNLAIGGDFPGILNPSQITALPNVGSEAKMYVDWVRVYQEEGKENLTSNRNEMSNVPEAERTITLPSSEGEVVETVPTSSPRHDYLASNVRSLFSNQYTNIGSGSFFDTWGSAGESLRLFTTDDGDKMEKVTNFGYVGFNYNSNYSATSMEGMDYMHCDIYPSRDMQIGITPISQGPQEYDDIYYPLRGNEWNCVDVCLADFKAANPLIDYSKAFQTKWFGGDQHSTIYIDNIFYFKGEPSGISDIEPSTLNPKPSTLNPQPSTFNLQGQRLASPQKGINIVNGRKFVVK